MRRATLTLLLLGALAAPAFAEQAPAALARPEDAARSGRYAFYPAAVQGGLEYLLDTATGDLWVLSRDADTHYFYLGYIPRAPQFPFAEVLRQKQLRQQTPGQQTPGAAPPR
jgi:hypothetical protein